MPKSRGSVLNVEKLHRNPVDQIVGRNVRARREALGYSCEYLARALNIDLRAYKKYERGQARFGPHNLLVVAKLFGVSATVFFGETCPPGAPAEESRPTVRT